MIDSFDIVVAVYEELPYDLSKPKSIFKQSMQCFIFIDKSGVVKGLICRNYNIFVMNNGQCFCNIRIFEYRC